MKNLHFEGLDAEQKTILECLWSCNDIDSVNEFIDALPGKSQKDAQSLFQLLIVDTMELYQGLDYKSEVEELIERVKR